MKNTGDKIPKVFLDTNILMDYILFRGDEAPAAEYMIESSLDLKLSLHIAAHSLTNLFYALRKEYSEEERNFILLNLSALCSVHPIGIDNIKKAIASGYTPDLEDALQIQCAVESNCDYFITRDRKLFEKCPVRTMLPHELIRELAL